MSYLELVLAPSLPDLASFLSDPYTNELVNSVIKAQVYASLDGICLELGDSPKMYFQLQQQLSLADFRKSLCINAALYARHVGFLYPSARGYAGRAKATRGTRLFRLLPSEFSRFDVVEFLKVRQFLR